MKNLHLGNSHFTGLHTDFVRAVTVKGYSVSGVAMHGRMLKEFLFFCETRGLVHVKAIKTADVVAYYEYIVQRPNQRRGGTLSNSMIRHQVFTLRLFFDYLVDAGELEGVPVFLPKFSYVKGPPREVLTVEEIKLLYAACETKRDRALLAIAYGCGLRRSEVRKLDIADVHLQKGFLVVREGKNYKSRTVPLSDSVVADLRNYLVHERHKGPPAERALPSPAFFANERGLRMSGDDLNRRLKALITRTGNAQISAKNITLHNLRHSIATHLSDNGAGIEFVQRFLGHASIDTTHLYAKRRKNKLMIMQQVQNARL